jgi:hypothetical protein
MNTLRASECPTIPDEKSVDLLYFDIETPQLATYVKCIKLSGKIIADSDKVSATDLLLAGIIDIEEKNDGTIHGNRPPWGVGDTAPISFSKKKSIWEELVDADDDENVEYVDEEQLLVPGDFDLPKTSKASDCGDKKKKRACKNCSCGFAEELEKDNGAPRQSACGSCYNGDAFRCSTCPHLGKPAFEPGKKVVLSFDDD